MTELGVNIDHIATLRQARGTAYPDPVQAANIAEAAGADLITLHLREDRRHIIDTDVIALRAAIQTRMNLEMAATSEMVDIAHKVVPDDVCLVPERREEITTEGGLDISIQRENITTVTSSLKDAGIRVSLFIDPDPIQVNAALDVGADAIEIHTGTYADAVSQVNKDYEYARILEAVREGNKSSLKVNAGHGLHYDNVDRIALLNGITELNIGHSIIARAVFVGLSQAVRDMKSLIANASSQMI